MSLTLHDNPISEERDCWIRTSYNFTNNGYKYVFNIAYIPDENICDLASLKELIVETVTGSQLLLASVGQINSVFNAFILDVVPKFVEFSVGLVAERPFQCISDEAACIATNSVYLSHGTGDWANYATLRLADPKFI